ncbi:MAG: hypothetical protein QHH30_07035 [candidate division NC10 bacterium]|nr:hypothetical protein [candidate division NC10 bacterium]
MVAPPRIFFHSPDGILGQVDRVELINDLDHSLQELPSRGFIHLLIDGILPVSGEAGGLPYQDGVKKLVLLFGEGDHLLEGRPVGRAGAFSLIHKLLVNLPATFEGVLAESLELTSKARLLLPYSSHPLKRLYQGKHPLPLY